MRTSSRLVGAALAFGLMVCASEAQERRRLEPVPVGSWFIGTVQVKGPDQRDNCVAYTHAEDMEEAFIAGIGELGVTLFTYKSPSAALVAGSDADVRLTVDGVEIELAEVVPREGGAKLIGAAKGRMEGSILRAIENGRQVVVEANGHRTTFELGGARQAMRLSSQCDMNGGRLPPLATIEQADVEALAEIERQAAEFDPEAMAAYFNREPAFAQMRCFIDPASFMGMWGQNQPATDVSVSIDRNGGGMVNGQTLEPVHVRSARGEPELVVYRGRELMRAIMHLSGPTHGFDDRLNSVLNEHFGQAIQFVPANRVFGFSIADEQVVVLDQASDGSMSQVGASECYRQR